MRGESEGLGLGLERVERERESQDANIMLHKTLSLTIIIWTLR